MRRAISLGAVFSVIFLVAPLFTHAATWTQLTNAGMRYWTGLAVSANGQRIVAATTITASTSTPGYIYTSSDGGVTWTTRTSAGSRYWGQITSSADGTRVAAIGLDAYTGYLAGHIYTSSDSGVTWAQRSIGGAKRWTGIASSADGMKLAATECGISSGRPCSGYGYIYTSTDGGVTWTQRTSAGYRDWWNITSSSDGSMLAVEDWGTVGSSQYDGYLYTSVDNGVTWTRRTNAGQAYWGGIASSADGMRLFETQYGSRNILTSTDGGATWIVRTSAGQRYWAGAASSADGLRLATADASPTGGYVYISPDGGESWTTETGPGAHLWRNPRSSSDGSHIFVSYYQPYGGYIWRGGVTINQPPTTPTIGGPTTGVINTTYTFNFTATDPDDDTIRYAIDWNSDGTTDEYAPTNGYTQSGVQGQKTHSWPSAGTQVFKVRTEDSQGTSSSWASYTTTIANPAPVVLLTASSNTYHAGVDGPITLTWSSSYATNCTGTNFSTGWATGGTTTVTPTETTTYSVSCTGTGGTATQSQTITYVPPPCVPAYSCLDGQIIHNSCPAPLGTNTSCESGYACSGGACVGLDAAAGSFGPAQYQDGHLRAFPSLVLAGDTTALFWNVVNAQTGSCTITGNNQTFTSESSGTNGKTTNPITTKTTYTLSCTGLSGSPFTERATINTTPTWSER